MNPILHPTSRERLIKFCGLLGSDSDGERANAARMADKLLRDAGLTWRDVISVAAAAQPEPPPQPKPRPRPASAYQPAGPSHVGAATMILIRRRDWLTAWEAEFLESLQARRSLTEKQVAVLARIMAKIEAMERGAA
jgi:hypothetical protein